MTNSVDAPALAPAKRRIDVFDLSAADTASLARWTERLPMADLGTSSQSVFETLKVLNECPLEPRLRFQLLEVLRPVLYSICDSLAAHYHSQPIVLPPKSYQVFQLSQAMQRQLIDGYRIAAEDASGLLARRRLRVAKRRPQELCARACHRALSDMTRRLFRGALVYAECGPSFWHDLHGLYRFALENGFEQLAFEDPQSTQASHLSIEQLYLKALLLGTVRSNQLRQSDLSVVFGRIDEWVALAELAPYTDTGEDQLAVDLDRDEPPVYITQFAPPADTSNCRLLVLDKLLYHLSDLLSEDHKSHLSRDLIKHLLISWGSPTTRSFMRMDSSDSLAICLGLANLHYFAANGVEFEDIARGSSAPVLAQEAEANPFLPAADMSRNEERDIWNMPFRPDVGSAKLSLESIDSHIQQYQRQKHSDAPKRQHDNYDIRAVNVSPGGYGLQWPSELFARLSNGDVVGIRETNQTSWSVGIVSWMQRSGEAETQLGVKLLGSRVIPFAAARLNHTEAGGHSRQDYSRVLLLPAIKSIGQPATLIASQRMFREKQSLLLVHQGRECRVRLQRLLISTGSISQFEIEFLDRPWQTINRTGTDPADNFSALWDNL